MFSKSFIDSCLDGSATLFDVDKYIEDWHSDESIQLTLREYLGMTDYEYEQWGKSSNVIIRDILRCRQDGNDFADYFVLSEGERIAARSYDQEAIDNLKRETNNENK